ncbi:MAG: hypothetical protein ONB44_23320 [candidate division KSB1 bacterium]|nr:hypothetical protein [candidate division KSB1 bacterium]MDZ7305072.1 hypothetical protein [candidate division KSB1 bacterium]MDZ7313558.1 hypothetical protein [candidate division KSB1 bacterium]
MSGIVLIVGFLIFFFALVGFYFWYTTRLIKANGGDRNAHINNLQITVRLILWVVPIAVLLLGILGYGTYEDLKAKMMVRVEDQINTKLRAEIKAKARIDSLTNVIEEFYEQSSKYWKEIKEMRDTLDMFILPVGTIIPYKGRSSRIPRNWHICDGTEGTPDLRDRFILGTTTFAKLGERGGSRTHTHQATLRFSAEVNKTNQVIFPLKEGEGPRFDIERHNHEFRITKQSVTIAEKDLLPPYYRLVYLMKIR